ncbi:MAG: triose-phosphate isomerase [Deltaproteobacteria bacterium]|nr:triose-phosphate isomerase [Deltaproteobacteria bacterium]
MKKIWLGSGWKMNKTLEETRSYIGILKGYLSQGKNDLNIFIVPPFTVLHEAGDLIKGSPISLGAQNMHWEDNGSFTGEISPIMLKDCGVTLVELGHSERRANFGETDIFINIKVQAAINHNLRPLICVGERDFEKQYGAAKESVIRQIKIALNGVPENKVEEILIAYEPVWAIGDNGTPAEPDYANWIQRRIKQEVSESYGEKTASSITVLYGGSVNLKNALSFIQQPDIDGLFIGRASWDANNFIKIIELINGG